MGRGLALVQCIVLLMAALLPFIAGAGRPADDDNGFETARPLGGSGFLSDSLDAGVDMADFYRLEASAGKIINASIFLHAHVAEDPGQVNFDLFLYNPLREQVVSSTSDYRYDSFKALALLTGTYYLKVATVSGSGGYTLDHWVGEAQTVAGGMTINGYLTDNTNRPSDWFRVMLTGGAAAQRIVASVHEDATALFDLYFMDLWSGYSFWYDISWWSDPDERIEAVATYTGYYYLQVNAFKGYGNYRLDLTVSSAQGNADGEPAGARAVPYNSSLSGHVDMAIRHYNMFKAELALGEVLSASVRLDPQPTDMFALSLLRPDMAALEGKTNYVTGTGGAADSLSRTMEVSKAAPAAGTYYLVVMAKSGLKEDIRDLSDKNAASDFVITINLSLHAPPPDNDPPAASVPGIDAAVDENGRYEVDLAALFIDPDGDALRYASAGGSQVSVELNASAKKAVLVPAHNWHGNENITLTATDPYEASASAWVNLTVRWVALPPEILEVVPAEDELNAANGSVVHFRIFAVDVEGAPLIYEWTADGHPLGIATNSTDYSVGTDRGIITLSVAATGSYDLSSSAVWRISCSPRVLLNVVVVSPLNRTSVKEGESVRFYAMVSGLTTSELANIDYAWYLGGQRLSDKAQFCYTSLPAGTVVIEVRAVNRSLPVQYGVAWVTVFVEQRPAAEDHTLVLAMAGVVMLVAVVGAAAAIVLSRRKPRKPLEEEDEDEPRERRYLEGRSAREKGRQRALRRKHRRQGRLKGGAVVKGKGQKL